MVWENKIISMSPCPPVFMVLVPHQFKVTFWGPMVLKHVKCMDHGTCVIIAHVAYDIRSSSFMPVNHLHLICYKSGSDDSTLLFIISAT